jgi:outer membrane protein assembly factor BamB
MTVSNHNQTILLMARISLFIILNIFITNSFAQNNPEILSNPIDDIKEQPKIDWVFNTKFPIFSSPIVSDSTVYFGGLDSTLYALNIKTGKENWKFRTNGAIRSNVCINNNLLYLNGGDGGLYALNKITGKQVWMFKTKGEKKYDFADYFQSTPTLANGFLYFGSGDGNLYAINAETSNLVWKYQTGNVVHTTPAIDNNKIFFGSFDGYVYALNLSTGELVWKFKTVGHQFFPIGEVQGSPSAFNHLIFIGARDYNIYAIDQEKGYCHWNKAFTRGWGLCNNIHDSILYIGSADERVLIAANPETGKEYWRKNMEFLVFGNNAYSESMMYLGTTIGKLHGISLNTGEKIWSFETFSYQKNRIKYFKPDDSYRDDIYSIIKSNEQFLDVECELGGIFSTPYISNKNIIFTSTNGILYCLKR